MAGLSINDILGRDIVDIKITDPVGVVHRYRCLDNDGNIIGDDLSRDNAVALRDTYSAMFGVILLIEETVTILPDGKKLFSGEISQKTPHVSSHELPIDPMLMEVYVFDPTELFVSLALEHEAKDREYHDFRGVLPIAPKTIVRKPRKSRNKSIERSFASISDPAILMDRGYVVIDIRTSERLFVGTKALCIEYITMRNADAYSRDRLPLSAIKIIKFADWQTYLDDVENNGYVVRHLGKKIAIGLKDDLVKFIQTLKIDIKKISVDHVLAQDLWWVQNRERA